MIRLQERTDREAGMYQSPQVYRCRSKHQGRLTRFGIGYVGPEGTCRREYKGPMLPGPYAYGFALASVVDFVGGRGTGAESAALRSQRLEFDASVGDLFVVGGELFVLREDRPLHDPQLVHLATSLRTLGELSSEDKGKRFLCEAAAVVDGEPLPWAGVLHGVEHNPQDNRLDPSGCTLVEVEHPDQNMTFYQQSSTRIRVEC